MKYLSRILTAHIRLYVSISIGLIVAFSGSALGLDSNLKQAIIGYDIGALVYILWAYHMMYTSTHQQMRLRAIAQDDGKFIVLGLVVIALIFSTTAIFADLAPVKDVENTEKYQRLFMGLLTILASWFFTNIVFALHYAHDYFFDLQKRGSGGLVFLPEQEDPSYFDFLYFAFTLGATAQTADVTLSSKKMRRTVTLHSVLAFFFNTTLLALTVNMAAGFV